jgi:hypothetical protein
VTASWIALFTGEREIDWSAIVFSSCKRLDNVVPRRGVTGSFCDLLQMDLLTYLILIGAVDVMRFSLSDVVSMLVRSIFCLAGVISTKKKKKKKKTMHA